jgi:hypothetical protein
MHINELLNYILCRLKIWRKDQVISHSQNFLFYLSFCSNACSHLCTPALTTDLLCQNEDQCLKIGKGDIMELNATIKPGCFCNVVFSHTDLWHAVLLSLNKKKSWEDTPFWGIEAFQMCLFYESSSVCISISCCGTYSYHVVESWKCFSLHFHYYNL